MFPGILRRLFQNNGAGPLLRPEIVPQQNITVHHLGEFYYFRHPTLKPGFQAAHGGVIANAPTAYPKIWAYLATAEGQKLCVTEAQWQAMVNAVWHTNADGSRVGWNGIGGAPFYAPDWNTGALRLPDLRGMYAEAAGFDALGVGGVHGDAGREIIGSIDSYESNYGIIGASGTVSGTFVKGTQYSNRPTGAGSPGWSVLLRSSRVAPTAAKNQPRAWGSLACVYLG